MSSGLEFIYADGSSWIIMEEIGLELEYFEQRLSVTGETNPTHPIWEDEYVHKSSIELATICSVLKNSKIYRRERTPLMSLHPISLDLNEVPVQIETEPSDPQMTYELRTLQIYTGNINGMIPVFPCQVHDNKKYWLTYGYREHQIFLLREDDNETVSFVALSHPIPQINDSYPRGALLDDYFLGSITRDIDRFISSQRFRLCCVVHEARNDESLLVNYADVDTQSMKQARKVKFHLASVAEKHKRLKVHALGCIINRNDNQLSFSLIADAQDPQAVFVLEETVEGHFVVVHHVHNLPFPSKFAMFMVSNIPMVK